MRIYTETELGTLITIKTGEMYIISPSGTQRWLKAGHYYRRLERSGMTMTKAVQGERTPQKPKWIPTDEEYTNTPISLSEITFDNDSKRAYTCWGGQLYAIDAMVGIQWHNVVRDGRFMGDFRDKKIAAEFTELPVDEIRYGCECTVCDKKDPN